MDSFSSRASIWVATAALKSLSSFKFSSSAFFSSIRARSAGDCGAEAVELLGARRCDEKDLVGYDILGDQWLCAREYTRWIDDKRLSIARWQYGNSLQEADWIDCDCDKQRRQTRW